MKTTSIGFTTAGMLLALGCGSEDVGSAGEDVGSPPSSSSSNAASNGSNAASSGSNAASEGSTPGLDAMMVAGGASSPSGGDGIPAELGTDTFEWSTGDFSVDPGQERYVCFSQTLDEDMTVNAYSTDGKPFVHHIIFARTRSPEADGFSECGTGFRTSWDPLFITGAGASTLQFPSDAGHVLTKGTQLLVQLHLLNLGPQPVSGALAIDMHRSAIVNPRPVNTYIVGTMSVDLPPMQETEVVARCNAREPVQLIAAFPHMHTLGRSMRFEVGTSADAMAPVFVRDPFDFNDQRMERVAIDLARGDSLRLTCKYQNTNPTTVVYGESTLNEMCYLIGFAIDRSSQGACIQ